MISAALINLLLMTPMTMAFLFHPQQHLGNYPIHFLQVIPQYNPHYSGSAHHPNHGGMIIHPVLQGHMPYSQIYPHQSETRQHPAAQDYLLLETGGQQNVHPYPAVAQPQMASGIFYSGRYTPVRPHVQRSMQPQHTGMQYIVPQYAETQNKLHQSHYHQPQYEAAQHSQFVGPQHNSHHAGVHYNQPHYSGAQYKFQRVGPRYPNYHYITPRQKGSHMSQPQQSTIQYNEDQPHSAHPYAKVITTIKYEKGGSDFKGGSRDFSFNCKYTYDSEGKKEKCNKESPSSSSDNGQDGQKKLTESQSQVKEKQGGTKYTEPNEELYHKDNGVYVQSTKMIRKT